MKQAALLGFLSAANIGMAFLSQWYVVTAIGAGPETDALFAGMALPQLVLAVIGGSLTHVLVPILSGESTERRRHDAWGFFLLVGGFFGALAGLLHVGAPYWVPLTVPGFGADTLALTINLVQIQLIGMVFAALNGVQWAAYHAQQKFVWAEIASLLSGVISIALLIWALPIYGVVAAAWIASLRMGLQTALLTSSMGAPMLPDLHAQSIRVAWRRVKPLLFGTLYYKSEPVIDRYLLSSAPNATLSLYYLAQQIYAAGNQVINKALAAPFVPLLSSLYKSGNDVAVRRAARRKLMEVTGLGMAGILFIALAGREVIDLLFGHGRMTSENVSDLWWIMLWLAGMFIGGVAGQISSTVFYAAGDTVTPTRMSIITYTVYIPGKIFAFQMWGTQGLALTTSAYFLINLLVQVRILRTRNML
ncbi:virulence factor MVIN family protein [Azoarcus sp. CIB]|uniref:lipid II flippase MurJ n=1 Tax=Aromatoleum sp. (strain CIB) TaxID=198107 RepID=UPI00067C6963|nr:lipid II flippase MurJ [Azoarcus sp. CIB]AKU10188.1 virulence factor MVIN family protein [Azoarcus sp. CIB]